MESTSLHPTPSTRTVVIEQFRAVGLALRTEAIFFIGALLVIGVLIIVNAIHFMQAHPETSLHNAFSLGFTYGASGAMPIMLMALLIPFGVWRAEEPSRRAYHWSMPVARGPHTVMKFAAGWAWLMIGTIVYLLFIVIIATAVPIIAGEPSRLGATPAWEWIAAFTATTLAYLLTSIAVIGSDHAWRWIGGVLIGYVVLNAVFRAFGMAEIADVVNTTFTGSYGLNAAFFGDVARGPQGSTWLVAMPLWIAGTAIAVAFASYRHRE